MNLRFEYCWLVLSFKADCKDDDRTGIPKDHLAFYYQKYFGKSMNFKTYGVKDNEELFALIKDAVTTKDGIVVSQLSDDLDNLDIFLKLSEEARRERQRRIDAGDETARLHFVLPAQPKPVEKAAAKPAAVAAKPEAKPVATTAGTPAPKAAVQKTTPAPAQGKGWGKGKGKW